MKASHDSQEPTTIAVIYCRVSSAKQVKQGDGLASQETRCREYARYNRYTVVEIFRDDLSGSLTMRPGMQAMLAFLRKNRRVQPIVIIDDISRRARGVKAHMELRAAIDIAGGILESPSVEFGEDADSELREFILASVAQHQRRKNAEQTVNRMRARVMNGYWPFAVPIGYRRQHSRGHGKVLQPNEPYASILREALESYACGRFETQVEVKQFLESQPGFPKDLPNGEIRNQRVHDILTRPIYAGYVEAPKWEVSRRKGQHEGLISYEAFEKIQARLRGTAKAPARKDINADFPLRGFVLCNDCGKPLTACWSTGKSGTKHPYYLCPTKGCASYRKSIRRDVLEGDFERILISLEPTAGLFDLAKAMFNDVWTMRLAQAQDMQCTLKRNIQGFEKQIDQLLERIVRPAIPRSLPPMKRRSPSLSGTRRWPRNDSSKAASRSIPWRSRSNSPSNSSQGLGKYGQTMPLSGREPSSDWPLASL